ncbi:MAG: hypothetical protein U0794_20385 [Isosphaeraceae bacterium]
MAAAYDRNRLIALLQARLAQDGDIYLGQRPDVSTITSTAARSHSAEGASLIGAGVLDLLADLPEATAIGGLTMGPT